MSRRRRRHRSRRGRHVSRRRRRRHVTSRRRWHMSRRRGRRRHVSRWRRRRHRSRRGRHISRRRRRRHVTSRRRRWRRHRSRRRRWRYDINGRRRRRWRRGKNVPDKPDDFRSQSDSAVSMMSRRRWRRLCECGYDRSRNQQTNEQFFHSSLLLDGCCFLLRNGRRLSSEALDCPEKANCAFERIGIGEHRNGSRDFSLFVES